MGEQKSIRKLAAIVFTDIVGFTALSAKDEEKAFALLDRQRYILKPIVNEFEGEWLKEIGFSHVEILIKWNEFVFFVGIK